MKLVGLKTATITSKGQISIPKDIREIEGFKEGAKIAIFAYEGKIEIRLLNKMKNRILTPLLSESSLSKDWNTEEEDEAWKNL